MKCPNCRNPRLKKVVSLAATGKVYIARCPKCRYMIVVEVDADEYPLGLPISLPFLSFFQLASFVG